jgi:prolyl 4-hydroxylase
MVPMENQEGMQILRYINGQKYEPHHDYFSDKYNQDPKHGGQRLVTVLMYLTTVEEGGETVFPWSEPKVTGPQWSECAKEGLAVKPVRGDAVMFFSLNPDGTEDPTSLHGSCPTVKGEKWSATKWIHTGVSRCATVRKNENDGRPCASYCCLIFLCTVSLKIALALRVLHLVR